MADERLKVIRTSADVLMGNLRGEVGELITTWLLLRHFTAEATKLRTHDPAKDIENKDLAFLWLLTDKLSNELIGRLSELGDKKIGRTNFYFASRKLKVCESQVEAFAKFVVSKKLRLKRNHEIAHREQPERWFEVSSILIPYPTLVKATAMALRLMKRLDRTALGPSAPFVWRETRKKRYDLGLSPRAKYMLVPYMHLSGDDRIRIVMAEQEGGKVVWTEMETVIDGKPTRILACKEWGLLLLGDRCLPLPQYPLINIASIKFGSGEEQPKQTTESRVP